jgi:hypothetical protein
MNRGFSILEAIDLIRSKTENEIIKEFGEMLKLRHVNYKTSYDQEFADTVGISSDYISLTSYV